MSDALRGAAGGEARRHVAVRPPEKAGAGGRAAGALLHPGRPARPRTHLRGVPAPPPLLFPYVMLCTGMRRCPPVPLPEPPLLPNFRALVRWCCGAGGRAARALLHLGRPARPRAHLRGAASSSSSLLLSSRELNDTKVYEP